MLKQKIQETGKFLVNKLVFRLKYYTDCIGH